MISSVKSSNVNVDEKQSDIYEISMCFPITNIVLSTSALFTSFIPTYRWCIIISISYSVRIPSSLNKLRHLPYKQYLTRHRMWYY